MMQEFVQSLKDATDEAIRGIHTALPGKIVKVDAAKGLVDVLPTMKYKQPSGKRLDFPKITGVPVVFPQSFEQKATIAFPIQPGDGCLIVFSEQSLDFWQYGQETDTDLAFDLSNAICIPGLFSSPSGVLQEACDQKAVIVDVEGSRLTVKKDRIQMDSKTVEINAADTIVNGNFTTRGGIVNLN